MPTEKIAPAEGVVEPTERTPLKVLVAVELVAWKYSATTCPTTLNLAYGLVVPIPKRLLVSSQKKLALSSVTALPEVKRTDPAV